MKTLTEITCVLFFIILSGVSFAGESSTKSDIQSPLSRYLYYPNLVDRMSHYLSNLLGYPVLYLNARNLSTLPHRANILRNIKLPEGDKKKWAYEVYRYGLLRANANGYLIPPAATGYPCVISIDQLIKQTDDREKLLELILEYSRNKCSIEK